MASMKAGINQTFQGLLRFFRHRLIVPRHIEIQSCDALNELTKRVGLPFAHDQNKG